MKILIIDDEQDILDMTAPYFEAMNMAVIRSFGGVHAQKMYRENDDIRLIMTDLKMPQISGLDLLREFKKIRPLPPTIVFTGNSNDEDIAEAKEIGAMAWIVKPFSKQSIYDLVQKLLVKPRDGDEDIADDSNG